MEVALGSATSLLGKVLSVLSDGLVAAYVDSLELGQNSEQIKAKLVHTRGLLQIAQGRDVKSIVSALKDLLDNLSRNADEAEDLLDEIHYFQIHDRLHGTNYATTQEAGSHLCGLVHHQALHARGALRHTVGSLFQCFSCSRTQDGGEDSAVASDTRGATNSATSADGSDQGDNLQFDRVSVSRRIKSVLQNMQTHCGFVSDLLGNIPSSSTAVVLQRPQLGPAIIQDKLYGREDTFEETVSRIITCKQTLSVLPIVGPGGIGKTTFTQHLYNDSRTKELFDVRVWVCVSTDFDVLKLTREILGCIPVTEGEGSNSVANGTTNLGQLQQSIEHRLKSKRFLIVLDDIWKCDGEDQWKTLLAPFTNGETKGSMVLVTTRFTKLAELMKTNETLELAGLESGDFITLFEACIFGDRKPQHYEDELASIAGKIANKLKGSPLAAKTVGRLLQKNLSQGHWYGVLQNNEWLKQKNDYDIMPSLQISYDYLPFDLKKCFSYFGLYPEDHRFDNAEMNHLFVAFGITDSAHQVHRNYLEELVDKGFLMKGVDDGHEYYVLHDLMHQLCRSVSSEECLNISDLDFRADVIPQSVRHLSITIEDRYDANFEAEMCELRGRIDIANLRTLMIFRRYEERIANLLKDCFKEINSLRVLFIVDSPESFPHRFSKLIHLKYLKINSSSYCHEVSLPSTLSRFYHLKFLDLDGWGGSSDLPKDFSHLESLHHFRAERNLHCNVCNVGKLKHLQELKEFHVRKGSTGFELTELGALTELGGGLIIRGLEKVASKDEATAAKLILKRNLKELELLWDRYRPTIDADILDALQPHSNLRVLAVANHGGTTGPSWLCLDIWLTNLETLNLEGISWSTLPPFGKLPNLKELRLRRISGMRQFGPRCGGAPGKCFVRLKKVMFHEMRELEEWVVELDCCSFPSLEIIECVECPNLGTMPLLEVSCTSFCKLKVSRCPKMSLPSMPHTSTLTDLVVEGAYSKTELTYDGKRLVVCGYGGALAFHNMDKVEDMTIIDVSHISLADIEKLKVLRELTVGRCNGLFPEDLDGSIVFRSVKSLRLRVSHPVLSDLLIGSKVLNCFPALSDLVIGSYEDPDYEERVVQFPSSSSLQKLSLQDCKGLVLVPVGNGGCGNSSLQSLEISECGKLFSRWPMEEAGGGSQTISPFPASLRALCIMEETSMKSMALLSNLTSLTNLTLIDCDTLTVDGFDPLIAANLKYLTVYNRDTSNSVAADLLSEVARTKLLPAGSFQLEALMVDNISGVLVAPICNLLAPALHKLTFFCDDRAESFTVQQEKALQLLTSLQNLKFRSCKGLQSLPQGLHRISSLEELKVLWCEEIQSLPKEGFPVSLRKLWIYPRRAEIVEQIEKIKRTNPDLSVNFGFPTTEVFKPTK